MAKPLISVIIPVFNTEKHLSACLDSVLAQSYCKLQVICINDGSTDNSPDILRQYKAKDNRIILLEQENRGSSAAKNMGLLSATGEFFAVLDSDDILLPHSISKMYDAIGFQDTDIVHGGHISRNYYTGKRTASITDHAVLTHPQALVSLLDKSIHSDAWGKIFRRSLFVENHLKWEESIRHAMDILIVYQAFHFARKVQVVPDRVYERTKFRPGSLENNLSGETFIIDKIRSRKAIANFFRSQGLWELHKERIRQSNERLFGDGLLRKMISTARGTSRHSIKDIVSACRKDLPEFFLSDAEIIQTIFRLLNESFVQIADCSQEEKKQIVRYVENFLTELNLDIIGLTPKEKQLAQNFSENYYNSINKSKIFVFAKYYCSRAFWEMGMLLVQKRARRFWNRLKMEERGGC